METVVESGDTFEFGDANFESPEDFVTPIKRALICNRLSSVDHSVFSMISLL